MCDMDPCSVADSLQISTSPTTSEEDGSTDSNRGAQATTSPYRYAKMCDITAMSVSPTADYAHFARVHSGYTGRAGTQSRAVTGPARRYPHRRGAFALASWVVRRCVAARCDQSSNAAVGRASRSSCPSIAGPVECGRAPNGESEWRTSRLPGMGRRRLVSECRRCTHIIVVRGPVAATTGPARPSTVEVPVSGA